MRREDAEAAGPSKVEETLKGLSLDDMTPREALEALYALKKEARAVDWAAPGCLSRRSKRAIAARFRARGDEA